MWKIGSVPYLNAKPLLFGLENSDKAGLYLAPPAQLHQDILEKKLDVALLPVVSYLEYPELKLIPGSGIACCGPVLSVKVFHRKAGLSLANTESIYMDVESKTSQKLLQILLHKKYERDFEEITWHQDPDAADSYLLIGDKALKHQSEGSSEDLGELWHHLTGLPFVFAAWMSSGEIAQELLTELHNAKMQGLQNIDEIAATQNILPKEIAKKYLQDNIRYSMNGPELVAMKLFFDWVMEWEQQDYDTSLRFVA